MWYVLMALGVIGVFVVGVVTIFNRISKIVRME